jgi:flagellar hook-associated protein 3 FlgL
MSISSFTILNQLTQSLQRTMDEYAKLNSQLASGKRIEKPSDDVIGMTKAIDYTVSISENEQFKRNIDEVNFNLEYTSTAMNSVSDSLLKLKELLSNAGNAQSQENMSFYAQQAGEWRDYLLSLSNSMVGNRYIFSGFNTDQKSFVYNPVTSHFDYQGDSGEINVSLDKGAEIPMNIQGSKAYSFSLIGLAPTELSDGTPVNYTQSTDPATGTTTITVEIGNAGDPDHDIFTLSNTMDLAHIMSCAYEYKNIDGSDLNADAAVNEEMALHRLSALSKPLDDAYTQALNVQAEIGTRQVGINDQTTRLDKNNLNLENALSKTEDADMDNTITELLKVQTALQVLRESASLILSESLLDFLK